MTWLTRLSLANRKIVAVIALVLIGTGVSLAPTLKQQLIPSLSFPIISISAQYPGASPEVVEQQVTEPLEDAVSALDGVQSVDSTSSQGSASITLSFDYGDDLDTLKSTVSDAIAGVSTLPSTAKTSVATGSFGDGPTMVLAATSSGDLDTLSTDLAASAVPKLEAVDGVESVTLTGQQAKQIDVTPDTEELTRHGLTASTVSQALQSLAGTSSAGVVTTDTKTLSVGVGGAVTSVGQLQDLWLSGVGSTGTTAVQLKDVASVRLVDAPATSITRTNGTPSLGISIVATQDGSASGISDAVRADLPAIQKSLPAGTKLVVLSDSGPQVRDSIVGLLEEGVIGLVMAVLIILLFLRSVNSTLVTAISIPISLLIAVIALWVGHLSLNELTLGGLTIAVGRVVDDSIVVLENIKRHLEYGEERRAAILAAVREVAGAVTSSTLTTVAVFLPIALLGGIVGQIFSPFAVAVTAAMVASLFVSLTVIPTLAYWFLRSRPAPVGMSPEQHRADVEAKESHGFLQRVYRPVIVWSLRYRKTVLGIAGVMLIGTVLLAFGLKTSFIGGEGASLSVSQTMPAATNLTTTDAAAKQVERAIAATDGVASYQASVGGRGTNVASYSLSLTDGADATAVQQRLQAHLDALGDSDGDLTIAQAGSVGSSAIEVALKGNDDAAVMAASTKVAAALKSVSEVDQVTDGLAADTPAISVEAIGQKAAAAGFTDATLATAVAQAIGGSTVTQVTIGGAEDSVVLQPATEVSTVSALGGLRIATQSGASVRLDSVATVRQVSAPSQLTRTDGERANTVSATPVGDDTGAASSAVQKAVDSVHLPAGVTATLGGVSSSQSDAFSSLILAMVIAVALILLVLLAVFGSFVQTAILLVSVPFAFTGAILMLRITGVSLGIAGLIGMLMLIGIVVTNAIVLMDRINQNRKQGMNVYDAVLHGGLRRLRPILMTALATMIALVPMALGISGAGTFLSTPLAVVVIGGLFTSTLLTLVLIPVLYTSIEGARAARRSRREGDLERAQGSQQPA